MRAESIHVFHESTPMLKARYKVYHVVALGARQPANDYKSPDPLEDIEPVRVQLDRVEPLVWEGAFREDIISFALLKFMKEKEFTRGGCSGYARPWSCWPSPWARRSESWTTRCPRRPQTAPITRCSGGLVRCGAVHPPGASQPPPAAAVPGAHAAPTAGRPAPPRTPAPKPSPGVPSPRVPRYGGQRPPGGSAAR